MICNVTSPFRYDSVIHSNVSDMCNHLIRIPTLKFITVGDINIKDSSVCIFFVGLLPKFT